MTRNDTRQRTEEESATILQELDLGCHTLFLLSDGSIDLLANDEQTPYLAENMLHLDSDETYRLFISLHEQFKQQQARMEQERAGCMSSDFDSRVNTRQHHSPGPAFR